ncbi:hypothetical protein KI387_034186, partial [Taxus chinensis]
ESGNGVNDELEEIGNEGMMQLEGGSEGGGRGCNGIMNSGREEGGGSEGKWRLEGGKGGDG